jgi:glyoxylase-like metal-dependent hydrolase (beta-lactamase superfamily II)
MNRLVPRLFALLSLAAPAAAQQDFSQVQITATHVAGSVHMLEGAGGNIGVSAGEDGVLIIDDQFEPLAERIRAALAELGSETPRFVLNTHWHGDHTGGNAVFGRDGTIIAHENVRLRLMDPPELMGRRNPPAPEQALPVVTFRDALTIHFNGEEIRVLHLPAGHTDGDSIVWFAQANVAHLGDDFFVGRFPFVDLASGGDVLGLLANIDRLLAELPEDIRLIPGHGGLSGMAELATYRDMLQTTIGIVRERMRDGRSLAEIQEAGLPDEWADWGSGFIDESRWLEIVHTSLTRSPDGPSAGAER